MEMVKAKNLKAGMIVQNDIGQKRTLLTDAFATSRGYVRAETSQPGNPVNVHGTTQIRVVAE